MTEPIAETIGRITLCASSGTIACLGISHENELLSAESLTQTLEINGPNCLTIVCPSKANHNATSMALRATGLDSVESSKLSAQMNNFSPGWKIRLLDSNLNTRSVLPIDSSTASLGRVQTGNYFVCLERDGAVASRIELTIRRMGVPEAIETGLRSLWQARFLYALSIFRSALSQYPDCEQIKNLLQLASALHLHRKPDAPVETGFEIVRDNSGMEAGAKKYPPDVLDRLADMIYSRFKLHFDHIEEQEKAVNTEIREIRNLLGPGHYAGSFSNYLGEACWTWLSPNIRGRILESEWLYQLKMNGRLESGDDYYLPLQPLSSAFESLIVSTLGASCEQIRKAIKDSAEVALAAVCKEMRDPREYCSHNLKLGMYYPLLKQGREILQKWPDVVSDTNRAILINLGTPVFTSALNDLIFFRNKAMHPNPVSSGIARRARYLMFWINEFNLVACGFGHGFDQKKNEPFIVRPAENNFPGIVRMLWNTFRALPPN